MQAQATRTSQNQLTASQSLASVQTLLRAGLGCITYLRNLLPADNFSESYLMSTNESSSQSLDSHSSFTSDCSTKRNISGFKIMTVTPGFTEEADKLLDFLENGIFDALQKQYLRSFIFAVYLDQQDPNNIVEAYTFNFNYHSIPGTDTSVPIMSLGEDLMRLSLNHRKDVDPVKEAAKQGKPPTLGEVKRSLKMLVKNLIQATTQMDPLPKRRYATFKLFYRDHTPADYEPPHFRAGDAEKDRWFFATHDKQEVPERCSVGRLETGWHGVDVRVASVSGYLPSTEDNNAAFVGTTCGALGKESPSLTPAEEAASRVQNAEVQRRDAEERKVVWDAEDGLTDMDADGEDDPDCAEEAVRPQHGDTSGVAILEPIGIRTEDGQIVPITHRPPTTEGKKTGLCQAGVVGTEREERVDIEAEAVYVGLSESVPSHVGQLKLKSGRLNVGEVDQTQALAITQEVHQHSGISREQGKQPVPASLPSSDFDDEILPTPSESEVDTQMLIDDVMMDTTGVIEGTDDTEMLDLNTQIVAVASVDEEDSIESFRSKEVTPTPTEVTVGNKVGDEVVDHGLDCDCGVSIDDDQCWCDGGCGRWYHVWCMGYHSAKDKRLPPQFICFDCRVRADQNWDLIVVHDLYPSMISKFKDLALFRRAIKIAEKYEPETLSDFTKLVGVESVVAGQLLKRLEVEGFIAEESAESDSLGLVETRARTANGKGRGRGKPPTRKNLRKQRYMFLRASKKSSVYQDYFNPDVDVEKRILGLSELRPKHKLRRNRSGIPLNSGRSEEIPKSPITVDMSTSACHLRRDLSIIPTGSQTQQETQRPTSFGPVGVCQDEHKRKLDISEDSARTAKKIKISIVSGVDLGD